MNNLEKQIVSFIYYNVLIRDTIEYAIKKDKFGPEDVKHYEIKKNGIFGELQNNTPLKNFIEINNENGEKLKQKIMDLYNLVYADDNTVCQVAGEELRVDTAQIVSVLENLIPVHEELSRVIDIHINEARQKESVSDDIMALVLADEKFYRGLVWLALIPELRNQFIEYNKARRDANGAVTPQSNFIQGDLNKLSQLLNFSRAHAKVNDREYTDLMDQIFDAVEQTQGRRVLREGHTMDGDFQAAISGIQVYISKNEPIWKEKYTKVMNAFVEEVKNQPNPSNDISKA